MLICFLLCEEVACIVAKAEVIILAVRCPFGQCNFVIYYLVTQTLIAVNQMHAAKSSRCIATARMSLQRIAAFFQFLG